MFLLQAFFGLDEQAIQSISVHQFQCPEFNLIFSGEALTPMFGDSDAEILGCISYIRMWFWRCTSLLKATSHQSQEKEVTTNLKHQTLPFITVLVSSASPITMFKSSPFSKRLWQYSSKQWPKIWIQIVNFVYAVCFTPQRQAMSRQTCSRCIWRLPFWDLNIEPVILLASISASSTNLTYRSSQS